MRSRSEGDARLGSYFRDHGDIGLMTTLVPIGTLLPTIKPRASLFPASTAIFERCKIAPTSNTIRMNFI